MIEVPALLWQLDCLLPLADFASVGSNDLLQFLFAADRGNARVADRFDSLNPAALKALRVIVEGAERHAVPLTLCGEMAGRPLEAMAVIGLGFRAISMAPASVGPVKAMILSLDVGELRARLDELLDIQGHVAARGTEAICRRKGRPGMIGRQPGGHSEALLGLAKRRSMGLCVPRLAGHGIGLAMPTGRAPTRQSPDASAGGRLHIHGIKEMPAGYDAEVAELFRDFRAASNLTESDLAARLSTRLEVVQALEQGALYALPPWAETCRVVNNYGLLLNLDVRPLLRRIYAQVEAGIVELRPQAHARGAAS